MVLILSIQCQKGHPSFVTMRAGDGGSVCMVTIPPKTKENPLIITVFNPLNKNMETTFTRCDQGGHALDGAIGDG